MLKEVFTVLCKGLLVDIMCAPAKAHGLQPSPTYQAGTGARTRMNGMFTDPKVAALLQKERLVPKPRVPGHDLLSGSITVHMAC